jgi:signal transduction histidine kinase/uncharacterized membrane protein affecting hemolysin expression
MLITPNMTIKRKLTLIIMLTCTTALLLAGMLNLFNQRTEIRKELVRSISCYAQIVGDNCKAALAFEDAKDASEMLGSLKAKSSIIFACVYTKEGKVLAHYRHPNVTEEIPAPSCAEEGYWFDHQYFRLFKRIGSNDEVIGTVYIQLDTSEVRTQLWMEAGAMILFMLVCLFVAYLVSLKLQRVISDPIVDLASVAKVISENKDYSTRAVKQGHDEVGLLIDAFNEMLEQIQQQNSALIEAKNELETRVRERTAELSLAYKRTEGLNRLKGDLLSFRDLTKKLKCITDAVVETFDADFARIWLIEQGDRCESGCVHAKVEESPHVCRYRDRCLHLKVSSGRYTHLDGQTHRRVPFGCYKIGNIAAGKDTKFLTSDVTHDPRVHNHNWARDLGLVSFAGYRLVSTDGEPVGVLAFFSKHTITSEEDAFLEGIANTTTQVIQVAMAQEELEKTNQKLIAASHQAGMAEVAADVLHNVGNVLNSINVSTTLITGKVTNSEVANLEKVACIINEHIGEIGTFLTEHPQGKHIPVYLTEVSKCLQTEQADIIDKLHVLNENVQHIKDIISMQQAYAKVSGVSVQVSPIQLAEDAIQINSAGLQRHGTELIREFEEFPDVEIDKQKVLQILVNLISNAKYALSDSKKRDKLVTIRIYKNTEDRFRIEVADNGVGIPEENLTKVFSHGFTTKEGGHGFGLHGSALAASQMGGSLQVHSNGVEQGATFILELPFKPAKVVS